MLTVMHVLEVKLQQTEKKTHQTFIFYAILTKIYLTQKEQLCMVRIRVVISFSATTAKFEVALGGPKKHNFGGWAALNFGPAAPNFGPATPNFGPAAPIFGKAAPYFPKTALKT